MNCREYYNRQNESWDDKEHQDIRNEYEINKMSIIQIADIHRRTPGAISYKLKNIGLIANHTFARGYYEYTSSDLYKEIVTNGKSYKRKLAINYYINDKKTIEEIQILTDLTKEEIENILKKYSKKFPEIKEKIPDYVEKPSQSDITPFKEKTINTLEKDVSELKTEIKSIKKDVKEILRLMNALYDFETADAVEESKESI